MSDKSLCKSGRRFGAFRRFNTSSKRFEYKMRRFPCGKSDCPICNERRRNKLILRLKRARWPQSVTMWTITTDPKVLDPTRALETMNRRWKLVHRQLSRIAPDFRFFRVIEFTASGLPHMHILTSTFIDWHRFQEILVSHDFGKVLHYTQLPLHTGLNYLCKYVSKELYNGVKPDGFTGRMWSVSQRFLPVLTYGDGEGEWELMWIDRREYRCLSMLHAIELHDLDVGSPP